MADNPPAHSIKSFNEVDPGQNLKTIRTIESFENKSSGTFVYKDKDVEMHEMARRTQESYNPFSVILDQQNSRTISDAAHNTLEVNSSQE